MTLDLVRDARHGDASLYMPDHFGRGPGNLRIDGDVRLSHAFELDHHEPPEHSDMRSRDADPGSGMHGLRQITRQRPHLLIDGEDRLRLLAQDGIRKADDRTDG